MSLLTDASLIVTPNAYKASKLYSVIPNTVLGDMNIVRATTATRVNSAGLIESVAINVPRLDYTLGSCPSILVEPARTNLVLRSEEFDNASWTKLLSSITANTAISPSDIQNADTFTANGISGFHYLFNTASLTTATTYSISVFAKKGTNNFIQLTGGTVPFGINFFANFDLNNGVLGTVGSATTARIENYGNDWYRCIITGVTINASVSDAFGVFAIVQSATSARAEANTLSTSIILWGGQCELGAYATSYIPTTTATVLRNADVITRNNLFTNGILTASGGTWFMEIRNNLVYTRDNNFININLDASSGFTNGFLLRTPNPTSRLSISKTISGSLSTLYTTTTDTVKLAIKWNGSTADVFANGVKVVSATVFTTTNLQNILTQMQVPVFINSMALFPTPLSDDQLILLTGDSFSTYPEMANALIYTIQ